MPSSVKHFECGSIESQADQIIKNLKIQLSAYPYELLGVICPLKNDLKLLWNIIAASDIYNYCIFQSSEEGYEQFDVEKSICVCSMSGAKGLEFRALHIAGIDKENINRFRDRQKKLVFTGITRAKTALNFYYNNIMPGYLESAFATVNPPTTDPTLDDLF